MCVRSSPTSTLCIFRILLFLVYLKYPVRIITYLHMTGETPSNSSRAPGPYNRTQFVPGTGDPRVSTDPLVGLFVQSLYGVPTVV